MKLTAQNYVSPLAYQGTFEELFIEDTGITHKRNEKYIAFTFQMYCIKNGQKVVLDEQTIGFQGMDNDAVTTSRATTFSIPNPEYDSQVEGSQERITVPMFDYLAENNNTMPADYVMVDYGYPTYEKVMHYFEGGTLQDPEIRITNPLAIGFLLSNLKMNNEPVGVQFRLV